MALGLKSLATAIFSASTYKNEDKHMRLTALGQALTDHKADFVVAVPNMNQKLAERGDKSTDAAYERAYERRDNAAVRLVRAFAETMPYLEEHAPELAENVRAKLDEIGFRFVVKSVSRNDEEAGNDSDGEDSDMPIPSPTSGSGKAAQSLAAHP